MCFGGSVPQDNSAELARQEEEARQARIEAGKTAIDEAFTGFDDNYYNTITGDYENYYNPQLETQYTDAMQSLTKKLAGSGNLTSSYGAKMLGDLREKYAEQQASIADQALAAANTLRSNVASSKNSLYSQNQTAADPTLASEQAAAATEGLQAEQTFTPLGDLFSSFLNNVATNASLGAAGYNNYTTSTVKNILNGGNSSTVVS